MFYYLYNFIGIDKSVALNIVKPVPHLSPVSPPVFPIDFLVDASWTTILS